MAHGADSRSEVRRQLRLGTLLLKFAKSDGTATTGTGSFRIVGVLEKQLAAIKRLDQEGSNLRPARRRLDRIMLRVAVQIEKNQRNHN